MSDTETAVDVETFCCFLFKVGDIYVTTLAIRSHEEDSQRFNA